ncbi:uncharacterized protein SAMN04515618_109103 [Collimonas sp. OK307]|uniref:PP0621 family protein n=1 Tax=Collimonas sp. OK307 TaxID=1801620 RepID=UPI0008F14250|nr:PP0621 family protein [Collimonas sp. OK307]SFI07196.1 uncharacterized protein SAMN04515618_109103 [Collimonas sp. OK307]
MKLIILIVIVLAVIVWLQRLKKNLERHRSGRAASGGSAFPNGADSTAATSVQAEAMVACAHCGMHFPASEALADASGTVFCSAEHRRLHSS